jgi:hypothetical protein
MRTLYSNPEAGSTLPIVMCLLMLTSSMSALLIQMSHGHSKQIHLWVAKNEVFDHTEKILHECEQKIHDKLVTPTSLMNCCWVERSTAVENKKQNSAASDIFFRVSVFGGKMTQEQAQPATQTRLQSIVEFNPIFQRISWREVIDLDWEYSIDQKQRLIWENLPSCQLK